MTQVFFSSFAKKSTDGVLTLQGLSCLKMQSMRNSHYCLANISSASREM